MSSPPPRRARGWESRDPAAGPRPPRAEFTTLPAGLVLIAGVSARAAAASAVRAGFRVAVLDAFADFDLPAGVRGLSVRRDFGVPFSAGAAADASRAIACDAVVYLSSFENHPDAVSTLAAGRTLWGNPPAVLRCVRHPRLVTEAFRQRGIPAPAVIVNPDDPYPRNDSNDPNAPNAPNGPNDPNAQNVPNAPNDPNDPNDWIAKPVASGGGHAVRRWRCDYRERGTLRPPRGFYLQRRIDGVPASVAFVSAGGRAVPIGMSRQLVGEAAFGAAGFRYCGNILAAAGDPQFEDDERLAQGAASLAAAIAADFDLVGVNGIDFIARNGVPYPIEVNPRWCGSMEVIERAYGVSVFAAHAAACADGTLPQFDLAQVRRRTGAAGKAIVFAREDVVIGDTRPWLADVTVGDVPHPGERTEAGHPVCTVYAAGSDAAACHAALVARAERVYAELDRWRR